jgi:hypothetical protein
MACQWAGGKLVRPKAAVGVQSEHYKRAVPRTKLRPGPLRLGVDTALTSRLGLRLAASLALAGWQAEPHWQAEPQPEAAIDQTWRWSSVEYGAGLTLHLLRG